MTKRAGVAPSGGTAARGPDELSGAVCDPGDLPTPPDALGEQRAVLGRDKLAWRRFVRRYDRPLREVVRHASKRSCLSATSTLTMCLETSGCA